MIWGTMLNEIFINRKNLSREEIMTLLDISEDYWKSNVDEGPDGENEPLHDKDANIIRLLYKKATNKECPL